ncbi:MAG: Rpn family recombination-promoting nuclease/putative transposase, partial [Clostridiales bacterium]|nr:Rpn family recombination-promoting nuclease/putative transposase [Clostridiales bacterium]
MSDGKDEAQADIDGRLLEVYERLLRLSPEKSRAYKDILDKRLWFEPPRTMGADLQMKLQNRYMRLQISIFKNLFNPSEHKERISRFLTLLLGVSLKVVGPLSAELPRESKDSKGSSIDIVCKVESGEFILV